MNMNMNKQQALAAIATLIDHAQERYPHFEDIRGQHDIKQALEALKALTSSDPVVFVSNGQVHRVTDELGHEVPYTLFDRDEAMNGRCPVCKAYDIEPDEHDILQCDSCGFHSNMTDTEMILLANRIAGPDTPPAK